MKKRIIVFVALVMMLLAPVFVSAVDRNVYVDDNVGGTEDGTSAYPYSSLGDINWTTIDSWADSGDKVFINLIRGSVWNETFDPPDDVGDGATYPITVRAYGNRQDDDPLLVGAKSADNGWTKVPGVNLWFYNTDLDIDDNVHIEKEYNGVFDGEEIVGYYLRNMTRNGDHWHNANGTVFIYSDGWINPDTRWTDLNISNFDVGIKLEKNPNFVIDGWTNGGIEVKNFNRKGVMAEQDSHHVIIDGVNTHHNGSFEFSGDGIAIKSPNTIVRRSIVHSNGAHGYFIWQDSDDSVLETSLLYNNSHNNIDIQAGDSDIDGIDIRGNASYYTYGYVATPKAGNAANSGGSCIQYMAQPTRTLKNLRVYNNVFYNATAIDEHKLVVGTEKGDGQAEGTLIYNNTGYGDRMYFEIPVDNATIKNNITYCNKDAKISSSWDYAALVVYGDKDKVIDNNIWVSTSGDFAYIKDSGNSYGYDPSEQSDLTTAWGFVENGIVNPTNYSTVLFADITDADDLDLTLGLTSPAKHTAENITGYNERLDKFNTIKSIYLEIDEGDPRSIGAYVWGLNRIRGNITGTWTAIDLTTTNASCGTNPPPFESYKTAWFHVYSTANLERGQTYTLVPSETGYTFAPANISVSIPTFYQYDFVGSAE
jgi:hypothetical protein